MTRISLLIFLLLTTAAVASTKSDKLCREAEQKVKAGDFSTAIGLFTKAIAADSRNTKAYKGRADARVALSKKEKGEKVNVVGFLPPDLVAYHDTTDFPVFQQAIDDYSKAIELSPDDAELYAMRSIYRSALADYISAVLDLTKAIELRPNQTDYYISRSMIKYIVGDMRGALSDADKAIDLGPADASQYTARMGIRLSMGDISGAEADVLKAIQLDSTHAQAWYNLGKLRQDYQGRREEAIELYTISLRYDSTDSKAYNNRGVARFAVHKDLEGAIADYTKAIELQSQNLGAWINRSDLYNRSGRHTEALADAEKAVALNPTNPQCFDYRGRAKTMLKQYEAAIDDFDKAESMKGYRTPRMYVYRAICLNAIGRPADACFCWNRALEGGFNDPTLGAELATVCR